MPRSANHSIRLLVAALLAVAPALTTTAQSQRPAPRPVVRTIPGGVRLVRPHRAITPYRIPPTASAKAVVKLPPAYAVDLRPEIATLGLSVRDQGSRGTCSVHAITFLLEYGYAKHKQLAHRDLSEEYLNRAANIAAGNAGDGEYFSNLDLGYQKFGIVTESALPYQKSFNSSATLSPALTASGQKLARLQPDWIKPWDSASGASQRQLDAAVHTIGTGVPVAVGMWWPKQGTFATDLVGGVPIMRDVGKAHMFDGHSVALVGFVKNTAAPGGGYFILRNSWGQGWDAGYGYVSFDYIRKYANDLLAYR